MFSFGFSLVIAALVGMILYTYLRNRKVSAPRLPGNDGGNIGYAGGAEYQEPSPEYQYFESRREAFLDQLYSRTSSPESPVTLTLRDWVDQASTLKEAPTGQPRSSSLTTSSTADTCAPTIQKATNSPPSVCSPTAQQHCS